MLSEGLLEKLIVWENSDLIKIKIKNNLTMKETHRVVRKIDLEKISK